MKRALFLGRFNPYHKGHDSVTKEMDRNKSIDEIIIGIGSTQLQHTFENPFTADEREEMIRRSLDLKKPYHIVRIEDLNDSNKWFSLVEKVCPEFNLVYTGNPWVRNIFEERGHEVIKPEHSNDVSATMIRSLMHAGKEYSHLIPAGTNYVINKINGVNRIQHISRPIRVTTDLIIDYKDQGIVLIKRAHEPYQDFWAIPGGHVESGKETLEECAVREAREETSLDIKKEDLKFVMLGSDPDRDPRGHYITAVYYAKVNDGNLKADDDAKEIGLFKKLPEKLAFDHSIFLNEARKNGYISCL